MTKIRVECCSGHRGEREPQAFLLGQRRLEVRELLDRWLGRAHRYFKVRVNSGEIFVLRHDEGTGEWELAALVGPESSSVGPAASAGATATRH
jgi:hypothetical protein